MGAFGPLVAGGKAVTYGFEAAAAELVRVGHTAAARGWVPATSGNFSVRLADDEVAITVSGAHKGELTADRIMRVDLHGRPLEEKRPSAETLLHVQLYRRNPAIQAVFHTHSIGSTVLSRLVQGELLLTELEVMKAFAGIDTHETTLRIPVFPNDQDMTRLAERVASCLDGHDPIPGYLIAGHGLYTWGTSVAETLRHLEAFEFLFQCELETRRVTAR
jgi:methylthioribulose-1-phosphate dehydratase